MAPYASKFAVFAVVAACASCAAAGAPTALGEQAVGGQANPPTWPSTVTVFKPTDDPNDIAAKVNGAFSVNGGHVPANHGQFSSARYAFLFEPGTYTVDVPVGYYTHVLGIGASPDDVVFTGDKGVYCEEGDYVFSGGALDTFWRHAEGFYTQSSHPWSTGTGMLWAVSQASPLRRVHVQNVLALYEYQPPYGAAGYSSGGYMGNSQVDGDVIPGSQQQFFFRNTDVAGTLKSSVWNTVSVGVKGAEASHCGKDGGDPSTTVSQTPLIAEKPFITIDSSGKYSIQVPAVKTNSVGSDWTGPATTIPFENVYVANNVTDTAVTINAQLSAGMHVVLAPGIYSLMAPLELNQANQVLMGLGMATLVSANGNAVITVGNVDGVKIAGPLLLQAGGKPTASLLKWGDGSFAGSATNPGGIYDTYARVGGPGYDPVQADVMWELNSGYVFVDNTWLWRADHTVGGLVKNGDNPCKNGLIVRGDNVITYALAVEHVLEDLTVWEGENGQSFFYQSEMPYDVNQTYGDSGFAGYKVASGVTAHKAYGTGVYNFFRDFNVTVNSGIVAPDALVSSFVNPMGVFLNGRGIVNHVINDLGGACRWGTSGGQTAYYCG